MATGTRTRPHAEASQDGLIPYRLTAPQFLQMVRAGVFPDDARVELLGGILATKRVNRQTTYIDGVPLYRLSVWQFQKMIEAGVFPETARVELLGGALAKQVTKNPPHDFVVDRLGRLLENLVAPRWIAREEKSVRLNRTWRPEPDVVVTR